MSASQLLDTDPHWRWEREEIIKKLEEMSGTHLSTRNYMETSGEDP